MLSWLQEEGGQEESSSVSVRSRRSKSTRRPRKQQPEQAPDSAGGQAPVKAAAAAHDQAPDTAGSHMPQHAHKRARVEPTQAPGRTGMEGLLQASAARPVQAFTPVQTPQRLSTPEAAEIRRDMTIQNAPGTQHEFHASGGRTPQVASQHSTPVLMPGQRYSPSTLNCSMLHPPLAKAERAPEPATFRPQIRFHLCRACPTLPTDCASSFGAGGIVHVPGA